MSSDKIWHVRIQGDKILGPFNEAQLVKMLKSGTIKTTHYLRNDVRTKGLWVLSTEIPGVSKYFEDRSRNAPSILANEEPKPPLQDSFQAHVPFEGANLQNPLENAWDLISQVQPVSSIAANSMDYWKNAAQSFGANLDRKEDSVLQTSGASAKKQVNKSVAKLLNDIEKEEDAKNQKEKKFSSSNLVLQLFVGFLVIVVGVVGTYGMIVVSKPLKLRWAADDALANLLNSAALYEAAVNSRLKDARDSDNLNKLEPSKIEQRLMINMEMAASELESIKSQMSPELREAWEMENLEKMLRAEHR